MTETETKLAEATALLKRFLDNPPVANIGCKQDWLENVVIGAQMTAHHANVALCELVESEGMARRGGKI